MFVIVEIILGLRGGPNHRDLLDSIFELTDIFLEANMVVGRTLNAAEMPPRGGEVPIGIVIVSGSESIRLYKNDDFIE